MKRVVSANAVGQRLDRFLALEFSKEAGLDAPSRAEIQRWISEGRVRIEGRVAKGAERVRLGEVAEVDPAPPASTTAQPEAGVPFDVLYMDADVVVVNKPAGVVVHPAHGHSGGTLVNGLLALGVFEHAELSEMEHQRPGIVHRLDKGTSGVMVVARTSRAREQLKAQFQDHSIAREYEAICVGDVKAQTWRTLHGRHPTKRMQFTSKVRDGKRAITHIAVKERLADGRATHVICTLETGRTHQIRMHLSEAGTPVLGDPLYGKPPRDPEVRALAEALGHQALHARLLGFVHPRSGKNLEFNAPPPKDFADALRALRSL